MGPGQTVCIGGDRGLSLDIHVHEDGWLSIQVSDPDRLTTALGTRPQEDWIAEHRGRLEQVRLTWPSEVLETAPRAYEWSPQSQAVTTRSQHPTSPAFKFSSPQPPTTPGLCSRPEYNLARAGTDGDRFPDPGAITLASA
ncbi:DUF5959 family protein, partial [Clavibacter michiganensis]|uniref:DUF5959 family protein n=1 Tax=Clavibacter michiganensis TaxID=28447 RepID=UPI00374DFC8A